MDSQLPSSSIGGTPLSEGQADPLSSDQPSSPHAGDDPPGVGALSDDVIPQLEASSRLFDSRQNALLRSLCLVYFEQYGFFICYQCYTKPTRGPDGDLRLEDDSDNDPTSSELPSADPSQNSTTTLAVSTSGTPVGRGRPPGNRATVTKNKNRGPMAVSADMLVSHIRTHRVEKATVRDSNAKVLKEITKLQLPNKKTKDEVCSTSLSYSPSFGTIANALQLVAAVLSINSLIPGVEPVEVFRCVGCPRNAHRGKRSNVVHHIKKDCKLPYAPGDILDDRIQTIYAQPIRYTAGGARACYVEVSTADCEQHQAASRSTQDQGQEVSTERQPPASFLSFFLFFFIFAADCEANIS